MKKTRFSTEQIAAVLHQMVLSSRKVFNQTGRTGSVATAPLIVTSEAAVQIRRASRAAISSAHAASVPLSSSTPR